MAGWLLNELAELIAATKKGDVGVHGGDEGGGRGRGNPLWSWHCEDDIELLREGKAS